MAAAVETGGAYDVLIRPGALADLPELASQSVPAHRYAIITDETVAGLYGQAVTESMRAARLRADLLTIVPGEASKTRDTWSRLVDELLELGMGRDGCVLALGGGVVGDLAGFVAATFMRGVPCINVPTTLLAMIDASVGGKTGLDVPAGKNLVGAFRQPRLVIIDPLTLTTLVEAEYRAGLAEAVKHAIIADADYLSWIEETAESIGRRDGEILTQLIARSVEIKAGLVAADTLESGPRAALNFGHTAGHALERLSGYRMAHGLAVAVGMVLEARLGERIGVTEPGTADRLSGVLDRLELPIEWPTSIRRSAILDAARTDKKARAGTVRFTLLERPGRTARTPDGQWTFAVPPEVVDDEHTPSREPISQTNTEV